MSLNKSEIVMEAHSIFRVDHPDKPRHKACLQWAESFSKAAANHGLRAIIQAGTAQFQFCEDTGANITHFSYVFNRIRALERLVKGLWPEMHVWNGIPETGEIVDLSVRYQPQQARELANLVWTPEFAVPNYFWDRAVNNKRFLYAVDQCATVLALDCIDIATNDGKKRV